MQNGERLTLFVTAVILGAKLISRISDAFFAAKVRAVFTRFVEQFAISQRGQPNVAQYNLLEQEVKTTDTMLMLIDDIEYLKFSSPAPLLSARCAFLRYKAYLLMAESAAPPVGHSLAKQDRSQKEVSPVPLVSSGALGGSKERILAFIQRSSKVRVRDVIREFTTLSGRTIKRNLKDLIAAELLKRVIVGNVVYYTHSTG